MNVQMKYLTLGLVLMTLAGCGVRKPIEGRADPYLPPQISFASADLANRTAISRPIVDRKNGILYVTVPIRATSTHDLHVDYRITFLGENGVPTYEGPWTGKYIESNTTTHISANSPNANATDWRMDFRYAQ